jgi:hypothetical protein
MPVGLWLMSFPYESNVLEVNLLRRFGGIDRRERHADGFASVMVASFELDARNDQSESASQRSRPLASYHIHLKATLRANIYHVTVLSS